MTADQLLKLVQYQAEEGKGLDIATMDVRGKASFTDYMVIVTGNSERHVKALAQRIIEEAKKDKVRALGIEGEQAGEWVLVDFGDVLVHIMLARTRDFYQLERLWEIDFSDENALAL